MVVPTTTKAKPLIRDLWHDTESVDLCLLLKTDAQVHVLWMHRLVWLLSSYHHDVGSRVVHEISVSSLRSALYVLYFMYWRSWPASDTSLHHDTLLRQQIYKDAVRMGCYVLTHHCKEVLGWDTSQIQCTILQEAIHSRDIMAPRRPTLCLSMMFENNSKTTTAVTKSTPDTKTATIVAVKPTHGCPRLSRKDTSLCMTTNTTNNTPLHTSKGTKRTYYTHTRSWSKQTRRRTLGNPFILL